ncbi:hypothetical protein [Umezawaea sp. Da 62-37]|uniref:hypothetical protein n=1 Tax=Umezawaea sp. Da 62-37 TaxID=3075927 RepID=UPI0028F740D8|nr:hypothetical protein [Umezawaea sp. Da 62-37]WNV90923.1 hypothetical protein RM788_22370 [Umezawaea sp. Da 62-37]
MTDSTGGGPQQPQQPQEPAGIDPEQLRQFQEFQRFQEYQRFQQGQQGAQGPLALPAGEVGPGGNPPVVQPPMPPPAQPPVQTVYVKPEPKPLWKVVLGSRLVKRLVSLAITLLVFMFAVNWAYEKFFDSSDETADIARDSGGSTGNLIAPTSPYGLQGTVGIFYKHVSQDSPKQACNLFAEDGAAKKKFTEAFRASDCEAAIHALHGKVLRVDQYEQPYFPDAMLKPPVTDRVQVSSCQDLKVSGGPGLGKFVLSKQVNNTWIITDYEGEPADCVTG